MSDASRSPPPPAREPPAPASKPPEPAPAPGKQDEVVLIRGSTLKGRIIEETDTMVVVEIKPGSRVKIPRSDIKEIRKAGP